MNQRTATPRRTDHDAELATEVALMVLGVATAFGFARLFEGWSFFAPLALAVVVSSLISMGCRRRGWGVPLSALASAAGLVLFLSVGFYRSSSVVGLPTRATWHMLTDDLSAAWSTFPTAIALVPPDTGYIVSAAVALWVAMFLSDSFAFRARAGPETLVAPGILFVFCSALAGDRLRLLSTALWLGAAVAVYALHRSLREDEGSGWLTSHRRGAVTKAARVTVVLGVGAIVAALVIGPVLPGYGEEAFIDTTNSRSRTRTAVSPLVDIRGRIAQQSSTEAFTVLSPTPAYWRLTAYERFDGRVWSSSRDYRDAGGRLGGGLPAEYTTEVTQQVTIKTLDSIWLPAAYAPTSIDVAGDVRFDSDTSSLVTRRGDLEEGQTYTVTSAIPSVTPADLATANATPPEDIAERYLELPDNYDDELRAVAAQLTSTAKNNYERALLLQNWFRTEFTYDLNVGPGSGTNAIKSFLSSRRGYCEQFAGTFAAFARSVGLPSRVAVGFTHGILGTDGRYHVQGRHAHAWPEVYFTDVGWLTFEPTPSRGVPGADQYTGVAAQQEGQAPATTTPTTAGTGAENPLLPEDVLPDGGLPPFGLGGEGAPAAPVDDGPPSWLVRLGIAVGIIVVGGGLWLLVVPRLQRARWRRRRRAATTAGERVLVEWHETSGLLDRAGIGPDPSETPKEYAARAARVGRLDPTLLSRLAEHATVAAYSGGDVPDEVVDDAVEAKHIVDRATWDRVDTRTKLKWMADPRPLLRPLPGSEDRESEWSVTN